MKGEVIIDMKGEISSTLPHSNEQTNELGVLISNILQDLGAYMRLNHGQTGDLRKTTLRLGDSHEIRIVMGADRIKAVVLEIDKTNQRIAVGLKQLAEDPWSNIDKYYKVGDLVTGQVTKLASFGAFIGLQHEIDGLVHISQISVERID